MSGIEDGLTISAFARLTNEEDTEKIMAEIEQRLNSNGCPILNLQVSATNTNIIAFYQALGYIDDRALGLGKNLRQMSHITASKGNQHGKSQSGNTSMLGIHFSSCTNVDHTKPGLFCLENICFISCGAKN